MNCANWKDNMHTFQTTRFCLKLSLSGWFPVQCRSFVPVLEKRWRKYKECCVTVANVTRNVILSLSGWFPVQCRSFVPVLEKRWRKYKECCVTVANVTRNVIWHALATSFHRERVDVLFRLCHESLFLYRWRFWARFTASRNEVRCCEWLGAEKRVKLSRLGFRSF